jgi:acetyl-CoA carboxylase biotin carboxyl carrier protein
LDLSELKGIVSIMQKSDLTELEIELKDLKLRMARPGAGAVMQREVVVQSQPSAIGVPTQAAPTSATPSPSAKSDDSKSFPSPMVGTFYRRPSPEDPEFVKVGDRVKKGDVLCIIEAMKVMNEIQSDFSGEIVETLIEDGVSVEFGQPLFKIRPA